MAKYIVSLGEVYADKTDVDEYAISTDSQAVTNTFTRKASVKNDTRVALSTGENLSDSMEKIDRYLQQLKDAAFYNPLTSIDASITSEENQVYSAKVVKSFYDEYGVSKTSLSAFANKFNFNVNSNAFNKLTSNAAVVSNAKGTDIEYKSLSELSTGKSNGLSVYDTTGVSPLSDTVAKAQARNFNATETPNYLFGSTDPNSFTLKPYKPGEISVKNADVGASLDMVNTVSKRSEGTASLVPNADGGQYNRFKVSGSASDYELAVDASGYAGKVVSGGTIDPDAELMTFEWKDEGDNVPDYVMGGPDKDNIHAYKTANLSVNMANYANEAVKANYVDWANVGNKPQVMQTMYIHDDGHYGGQTGALATKNLGFTHINAPDQQVIHYVIIMNVTIDDNKNTFDVHQQIDKGSTSIFSGNVLTHNGNNTATTDLDLTRSQLTNITAGDYTMNHNSSDLQYSLLSKLTSDNSGQLGAYSLDIVVFYYW